MVKSTFFTGQPVFAQLCKYLDRDEVLKISTESGGERYRKSFDAWTHLRMGSYQSGARWGTPTQKGASRSLETTISCRSTRTWTMATFVFHKDGTTHRARIVSYVETKTSRRGCKEQEVQLPIFVSFPMDLSSRKCRGIALSIRMHRFRFGVT